MDSGLKVLMVSSDRNILSPGSAVSERMKDYGKLVSELHIVLLSDKSHGLKDASLSDNIWVYPTNSSSKLFRSRDAAALGKRVVFDKKFVRGASLITVQDPFECGLAGRKVKRKWRLPLEAQLHTDPFSPYFSGFLNILRKRIARKVLRNTDQVRVVSEYLKKKVEGKTSAPISVLPILVDKERIESAPIAFDLHARYPWSFIMLAVSRLSKEKDLGTAIRALAIVREKYPDAGLLMVGDGPEKASIQKLVDKLNLGANVEFAGWQTELGSYYKTANAFIQTSLFEGYGLSLVEAGLSELPVITTPVGIGAELESGKDAYTCTIRNPGSFAAAMIELVESNQKRENLKFNLKRTLESKLISKEEYLNKIKSNWEEVSKKIK